MERADVILVVEDSADDFFLLNVALDKVGIGTHIARAEDGLEAVKYLEGTGVYADRKRYPLPCLMVTDLKMPRMDGFELLEWMKHRDELRSIPVLVLSSSGEPQDRQRAAELGASDYFVKPSGFRSLAGLVEHLKTAWIASHSSSSSKR